MKILNVDQDSPEWITERKGRIMGSKLKDLYSTRGERKDAFYQLIADNLILLAEDESDGSDRDRGHEKELEAIEMFESETGKTVETKPGMWISDENDRIGISPDGAIAGINPIVANSDNPIVHEGIVIGTEVTYTEALEIKSLAAKNHVKAICQSLDGKSDREILKDYWLQVVQYFLVNPDLKTLHFIFYDDRITAYPFFMIDVQRKSVEDDIVKYREFEEQMLADVATYVNKLAF